MVALVKSSDMRPVILVSANHQMEPRGWRNHEAAAAEAPDVMRRNLNRTESET